MDDCTSGGSEQRSDPALPDRKQRPFPGIRPDLWDVSNAAVLNHVTGHCLTYWTKLDRRPFRTESHKNKVEKKLKQNAPNLPHQQNVEHNIHIIPYTYV